MQPRNLPTISPRYWTAILAASMCGANTGDFLSRVLGLGHTRGLLPLAVLFAVIVWAEKRAKAATEAYYWLAIIVLRTGATNLADLMTHDLKLGYGGTMLGLTIFLVAVVALDAMWRRGTPSDRQSRMLPATDLPYWLAMLTAGTLGTAAGDFMADETGLGVGFASLVLVPVFIVVVLVSGRFGAMTKPWYWASIIAARTAGTTLGDFVVSRHGLNLGLPVGTLCTACLLAGIIVFWRNRPLVPREA